MSGKIIVVLITLILAMVALIVLWRIFRVQIFGTFTEAIDRWVEGFANAICERIPFCKWLR